MPVIKQRMLAGAITLLGLLLAAPALAEALYRWQDGEGNWHFSDSPPAEGQGEALPMPKIPTDEQGRRESRQASDRVRQAQSIIDRAREQQQQQQEQATAEQQAAQQKAAWKQQHCRTEQRPIRRGLAGGGTRLIGHREVLVCDGSPGRYAGVFLQHEQR